MFAPGSGEIKGIWKNVKKDGSILFVEISTSDIVFENKKCHLAIANDVTDKLSALNQVKESEARLITSQRIAHIGSWEVDLSGDPANRSPIKWTDETYRIFGFEPNEIEPNEFELTSDFFKSLVHPEDHPLIKSTLENAIANKSEYNIEFRIIRRDGTERILTELAEIIYDEKTGKQLKITGTVQDITERKQAAKLLEKSEANLRSIFENTETVYVLLDLNLNVVSFNNPASKFSLKHLNKEVVDGTSAINYFPEDMQAQVKKSLKGALAGMNLNFEVSFPEPDGTVKWYYAHFHPVWSEEQKMLGVIMSLRDITERKTSEIQEKKITAELIQRNKDLEQFAYIISHNLRAPVANILGVAEALNDDQIEDSEKAFFMDGLRTSAKKLDNIITDLNRILQMKHEVAENKEMVYFSQLVKDIKFTISGLAETELFQIKCDFEEVDEMLTLKSYMHSIFYNLISNSLKYKQPDLIPVIEIKSRKTDNKIELTFRDNGLGIDLKRNGEQLFGLYKRFHQQAAEGKGMGLFMVKTQVETLGGKINVASEVGKGTEFKLEFEISNGQG
jgi:PAS domain S-box-containing protein